MLKINLLKNDKNILTNINIAYIIMAKIQIFRRNIYVKNFK